MAAAYQFRNADKSAELTAAADHEQTYGTTEALDNNSDIWLFNDYGSVIGATMGTTPRVVAKVSEDGGITWRRSGHPMLEECWIEAAVTGVDKTGDASMLDQTSSGYTPLGVGKYLNLFSIPKGCGRKISLRSVMPQPGSEGTWLFGLDVVDGATNVLTRCRTKQGAVGTACTSGNVTVLLFDTEDYDIGDMHSTVTNTGRITIPSGSGGVGYIISGNVELPAAAGGTLRSLSIRKNGATILAQARGTFSAGAATVLNISTHDVPNAGDYYELLMLQDSGGSLTTTFSQGLTWFAAAQVWVADVATSVLVRCRAKQGSAGTSLTSGAATALLFDAEDYDIGAMHSTVTNTNRMTIPTSAGGVGYILSGNVEIPAAAGGTFRALSIRKNGTTILAQARAVFSAGAATVVNVTAHDAPSAGDYYELLVFQDSGGALTSAFAQGLTWFAASQLMF